MKKKILAFITSLFMVFGVTSFSACDDITDVLDMALSVEELESEVNNLIQENETLSNENNILKNELFLLKTEVTTLKFESKFPKGLINESCTLKNINIVRTDTNPEGSVYAVRADGEGVEVIIDDGFYDAGSGSLYNIAVWAHNGSKIVINNGTFKTGADINGEANHVIYAAGNSTIEINGGWFESIGIDAPMMINCQDGKGTIIIKGGTFVNFDPSNNVSEGKGTSFVAEGYVVVKEIIEGVAYYTVVEAPTESEVEEESSTLEY